MNIQLYDQGYLQVEKKFQKTTQNITKNTIFHILKTNNTNVVYIYTYFESIQNKVKLI